MSKYTVVGVPQSTCTRRVLMTLEEKGVAYDIRGVDFPNGEHKTDEYKQKFNPFGRVPVLLDGDFKLIESRAISRYIAENNATGTSLIPSDPKAKGLMDQWIFSELCEFAPAEQLVKELFFKKFYGEKPNQEVVNAETQKLHVTLKVMDDHLKNNQYLAGEQFTIADIFYMPYTNALLNHCEGYANIFDAYPSVAAWWQRISNRPTWQKVLAMKPLP